MPHIERIMHVLAPAPVGGLERVVQMLSRGQAAHGHKVDLAVILDAGSEETHPFPKGARSAGVGVNVLPVPHRKYLLERRLVRDLSERLTPTVIHLHGARVDVLHTYLGRRLGLPVITTAHGFIRGGWKGRFYEKLQLRSMRRMDGVVAVSPLLKQQLPTYGIPEERVHLVMNGIDEGEPTLDRTEARTELGVPPEDFRVGYVGRLSQEKGPDVLVEALGLLRDLPLFVSFVGDGPLAAALNERALELGVHDRIHWHGRVEGAGGLIKAFDLLALSSRTEGTPITLLEAMSAGVPVVATRVGGMPDVVSEDEALLVPSQNPEALAAAIRSVFNDPEETKARAGRAHTRLMTQFSMEPWVRQYDEVYEAARRVARPWQENMEVGE